MRLALTWIALSLCVAGCQGPSDRLAVDAYFVVVRLHLDPSTRLGEIVGDSPEGQLVRDQLNRVDCTADVVVIIHIEDGPEREFGRASVLLGTAVDATDLCDSGGPVIIQPLSFRDPEMTDPLVGGPLLIEGRTLDGRLPLGELDAASFEVFPAWWQISGRMVGADSDTGRAGLRIEEAEARAVWRVRQLFFEPLANLEGADPMTRLSMLDALVATGVQPDVDVDGDGRERFLDTDGDGVVDRCIEGDGQVFDGLDCPGDPRFADGYDLKLIFRLERAFPR